MELPTEAVESNDNSSFDDDGHEKRTGTRLTVGAHVITAVIGSGVLSLAWAVAQLGWIGGAICLVIFSIITMYTSNLLADCYRFPDAVTGTRNYTYGEAVEKFLGGSSYILCGLCQYVNLIGTSIGYIITAALSIGAIQQTHCHQKHGREAKCHASYDLFTIVFGIVQILASQIRSFRILSWLYFLAAVMSFTYSFIGICLSIAKISGGSNPKTSLTGISLGPNLSSIEKMWSCFQALGVVAFAYSYSQILIEIEDTIKSGKPENKMMKQTSELALAITTVIYMLSGFLGYVAFGDNAPANFLASFGYIKASWVVDIANVCIVVHFIGGYQAYAQPVFLKLEAICRESWPESGFVVKEHRLSLPILGAFNLNFLRLVWRSLYVALTCFLAIMFPFFNAIMGLLGALIFCPLTVYFPVEMHISQHKIPQNSPRWLCLKALTYACLIISILAAAGSVQNLATSLMTYRPFMPPPES